MHALYMFNIDTSGMKERKNQFYKKFDIAVVG